MSDRVHERVPYAVEVNFRTASSFLVAYSLNLSRGGLFIETEQPVAIDTPVSLQLTIPTAGAVTVNGTVSWRREHRDENGPAGIGVAFSDLGEALATIIDELVAQYAGLTVLLLCPDLQQRSTLSRTIRSIFSTAEVVSADDYGLAGDLLDDNIDLVIIDGDSNPVAARETIGLAHRRPSPIPIVTFTADRDRYDELRSSGSDEVTDNPPPFADLQRCVVRAMGRPASVTR